jgi:uncharacterized protein DUF3592
VAVRGWGARRWVVIALSLFGAVFLAVGLTFTVKSVDLLAHGKRAHGTVVDVEWETSQTTHHSSRRSSGTSTQRLAYSVVEFTSADGRSITFRNSVGSNPPSYGTGDQVDVLYPAGSPEDAAIDSFSSMWLLPLIFDLVGLVVAGVVTAVVVVGRRRA